MSNYTVGVGGDFATLSAAAKGVKPGDVVDVLPGLYRETVRLTVPGVVWRSVEPWAAILDGGWDGKKKLTGYEAVVNMPAKDLQVRGFTIRNCNRGIGLGKGSDGSQVIGNRIDNCYHGAIAANGGDKAGVSNLLIEGNVCTRMGQERLVTGGGSVSGSFNFIRVMDSVVRGNRVSGALGEGIDVGKGSYRLLVTDNDVFATEHVGIYLNRCVDCIVDGNRIHYVEGKSPLKGSDEWAAGIIIGDERSGGSGFPWSSGNRITNNLVVGYGKLFMVRNNTKADGGYDTQLLDTVIAHNTFVAGQHTLEGVDIATNQRGRPHKNSGFHDNVIYFDGAAAGADIATFGAAGGVDFHHNAWSAMPPSTMRGAGDVYGDALLVRPGATIAGDWSSPDTDFDKDNYRPKAESPLIGRSATGATIGALTAAGEEPPVDPPPDPEPEPGRDDIVRGVLSQQEELLATASAAIMAARANAQYLIQLMNENENQGEL